MDRLRTRCVEKDIMVDRLDCFDTGVQVFSLQEKAQEVSSLVVSAEERLAALDKCPFQASSMGAALASLQVHAPLYCNTYGAHAVSFVKCGMPS